MTSLRHNSEPAGASVSGIGDPHLDAARAAILDVGWRRTTLTEVARRAGTSRMTVYRRWSDMGALLADLMTREWTGLVGDALPAAPADQPASERVVDAVVAVVRALRENDLFVRIVELDPELLLPYLLQRRGRSQDLVLALLEEEVRRGQEAGDVRAGSPAAIARGLLLAAHGFVLSAHTMVDDRVDEDEVDAELAHLVRAALRPVPGGAA